MYNNVKEVMWDYHKHWIILAQQFINFKTQHSKCLFMTFNQCLFHCRSAHLPSVIAILMTIILLWEVWIENNKHLHCKSVMQSTFFQKSYRTNRPYWQNIQLEYFLPEPLSLPTHLSVYGRLSSSVSSIMHAYRCWIVKSWRVGTAVSI